MSKYKSCLQEWYRLIIIKTFIFFYCAIFYEYLCTIQFIISLIFQRVFRLFLLIIYILWFFFLFLFYIYTHKNNFWMIIHVWLMTIYSILMSNNFISYFFSDVEFQLEFNWWIYVSYNIMFIYSFIKIFFCFRYIIRFQGHLNKYTNAFKGYQNRYFVLDAQAKTLLYFMVY